MKIKKLLLLFLVAFLFLGFVGCGKGNEDEKEPDKPDDPSQGEVIEKETFTVIFESEGTRHATVKVKDGEKITAEVNNPSKDGYSFVGWFKGEEKVDLATFVVTENVTLVAKFESDAIDNTLDVNAKKEAGKTYTLVIGWWEVKNPDDPDKKTSYLTEELVKKFYTNVNLYLKVKGLSDAEIANVQFRNYSTATVADMGALVNEDGDVDIMIGVGNNINSTAGVALFEGSNDNKFATLMGSTPTSRYVALTSVATTLGVNVYDWLTTETGKKAFNEMLKESDIQIAPARTSEANVDVTVHTGVEDEKLHFASKDDEFQLPEVAVPEGYVFDGFALSDGGELVLSKANGDVLKYADIKGLLGEATSIELFPVYSVLVVSEEDLNVYIQLNSGLKEGEAELLAARFKQTVDSSLTIAFTFIEGNADAFTAELANASSQVDVIIGGNNPLKNYPAHEDGKLANAGAKHFADGSRKVLIHANTQHLELAKKLYDFVVADAPEYELHITFWLNENKWITVDELAALKSGLETFINTRFALADGANLYDLYNFKVTTYDATNTKVAELGEETRAQRDGKGTDLIVGCGANVTTTGGFEDAFVKDINTTMVAAGRKVALINSNPLTMAIYFNFFTE